MKIESAQMVTVVRRDPEGRPFLDGLCVAFDSTGVDRHVADLHTVCPEYATFAPIEQDNGRRRYALVEVRFVRWSE